MFIKKYNEFLLEVRDKAVKHAGDKEKKEFENNDGSDKELEKTIESLGTGMISMSQAFVEKYGSLKEVVQNLDKELLILKNKNK